MSKIRRSECEPLSPDGVPMASMDRVMHGCIRVVVLRSRWDLKPEGVLPISHTGLSRREAAPPKQQTASGPTAEGTVITYLCSSNRGANRGHRHETVRVGQARKGRRL